MNYLEKKVITKANRRKSEVLFQFDGAPYHHDDNFREYLFSRGLHFIFSGPHSYDAAPCEKVFALIKRGDLLPPKNISSEK